LILYYFSLGYFAFNGLKTQIIGVFGNIKWLVKIQGNIAVLFCVAEEFGIVRHWVSEVILRLHSGLSNKTIFRKEQLMFCSYGDITTLLLQ